MSRKTIYLFFLWTLSIFAINKYVESKVFQGTFKIKKNEKIHYLTKFSCDIGVCKFGIKLKLKDNIYEKLFLSYYKLNGKLLNDLGKNTNNDFSNANYDNVYDTLTKNNIEFMSQRITLVMDNEQKYVNDSKDKCYEYGRLRYNEHVNIPFAFKYYNLLNTKSYDKLKNYINNKYFIQFNKIYNELKNRKLLEYEILRYAHLLNEQKTNYVHKDISAKTTHRIHVWFLMFDDCYDSLIYNIKLNIKMKLVYWEYLLNGSNNLDISTLAYDSPLDDDKKFYNNNDVNKKIFLENPKRLLFLEKKFTKSEIEDIEFFLKSHNIENMKSFTNIYNNLYKNGFYEKIIDYIYENDGFTIEYDANILQTNKSHFSYELLYYPILNFILIALYLFLILQYGNKLIQNIVSKQHKHATVLCVAFIISIQLLSNTLFFIHLLVYSKNGVGLLIFEISFNLLNFLAQIVMCTMLLSLSYGLTIIETSIDVFSRIKIIFGVVLSFHVVLIILDNTYIRESSSKYFDNDNITGYIIVFLRMVLAIIYHVNMNNLFIASKMSSIRSFLKKMYIFGLFYILSFPIIFMICYIFDTYWRQRFMLFGTAILQFVSTYLITKMFLTNSEYFKVSDMSASVLPGATSSLFNQKLNTN